LIDWFITLINYRPDALSVWSDPIVKERLSHYYSVMKNEKPARFLAAKLLPLDIDPYSPSVSVEELWRLHDKMSVEFEGFYRDLSRGGLGKLEDK
jgi:putative pyruvate formate lyase activating enzyme